MCKTITEQYVVPIFARGPRPILDFPDEVVFPVVAVKDSVSKTILVRNVGDRRAEIVLSIDEYVLYLPSVFSVFTTSVILHVSVCSVVMFPIFLICSITFWKSVDYYVTSTNFFVLQLFLAIHLETLYNTKHLIVHTW